MFLFISFSKMLIKILQVLPYSYHIHTGGVEKIAQTLSDGLSRYSDIQIKNLASDIVRGSQKDLEIFSDTIFQQSFDLIYNFPVPKFWKRRFWQQFIELQGRKPDIVLTHTRFFLQSMIGGIFAKVVGCKWIHIEHGSGFLRGYPGYICVCARLFDQTIGRWIFCQCDHIITISQMHKQFISKFTKKDPFVIYNPIDYQPRERNRHDIVHIGFVGRLVSLKGVDVLIRALYLLEEKERICTIVGSGSEEQQLKQLVQDLGLADRITFVGSDNRDNWMHKFDIFVNPSYQEGLPTTVVEALIAGCLVVATDVGGTREISDKEDIIIVKSGDINALKVGIEKAFSSLDKQGLSCQGVMEKFSIDGAMERYREILFYGLE